VLSDYNIGTFITRKLLKSIVRDPACSLLDIRCEDFSIYSNTWKIVGQLSMMRVGMNVITVYRWMVPVIALLVLIIPCAAYPSLTGSGVSQSSSASWDSIMGPKNTWSSTEGDQWMMGWIKIVPGSELDNGVERYKYKYDIAATGSPQSGLLYGPFPFYQGDAKMSRQVNSLYSSYGPGSWEVRFYITDIQGGSDTLIASIPFTLQGAIPTTATTIPTTTITTAPATTVPITQVQVTSTTSDTTQATATTTATLTPLVTTQVPLGSIAVTSIPMGAMVFLDDREQGITPITLHLVPAGMHAVRIHAQGYVDNVTQVMVAGQMAVQLDVTLLQSGILPGTTGTTTPVTVQAETLRAPVAPVSALTVKMNDGKPMEGEQGTRADRYYLDIPIYIDGLPNDYPNSSSCLREIDIIVYSNLSVLRQMDSWSGAVWTPRNSGSGIQLMRAQKNSHTGMDTITIKVPDEYALYHDGVYLYLNFEAAGSPGDSGQVTCEVVKAVERDGNVRTARCEGTTVTIIPQKPRPTKTAVEPFLAILSIIVSIGFFRLRG
jgi:hypothetical protein